MPKNFREGFVLKVIWMNGGNKQTTVIPFTSLSIAYEFVCECIKSNRGDFYLMGHTAVYDNVVKKRAGDFVLVALELGVMYKIKKRHA
jgi:hypothetical protein